MLLLGVVIKKKYIFIGFFILGLLPVIFLSVDFDYSYVRLASNLNSVQGRLEQLGVEEGLEWELSMESAKLANLTSTSEISVSKATRNESLQVKKILYFNHFFHKWDWKFGQGGPELFQQQGCRVTNCYITSNNTKFGTIAEFDAVLFFKRVYNFNDPNVIPDQKQRKSNQRYVMMVLESPIHDYVNYDRLQDFFNWTMTYRIDSDIPIPYGFFVPKDDVQESIQNKKTWRAFNYAKFQATLAKRPPEFLQMAQRPNQVVWYVSHCNAASDRDKYVAELSKYINVSIYGKCTKAQPRIDQVLPQFKFYLSFENSFCADYITEKFFERISQGVLPIVLGGGNYTQVAPPHSFINVLDFPSPQELAKYLIYLDQNREQYLSYFWWMDYYSVIDKLQLPEGICQLCQMLNADLPVKTYHSMSDWWRGSRGTRSNSTCQAKSSFPWSKYSIAPIKVDQNFGRTILKQWQFDKPKLSFIDQTN